FNMDGVTMDFSEDALNAIADATLEKKTGARGLRAMMEKALLPLMYEIPSMPDIKDVVITKECVLNGEQPLESQMSESKKKKLPSASKDAI
ncbi:MAG: ATP-dependent Clp protease ATP-binding subunit ClpX, partial [Oscillospiraceae bacterium]